MLEHALNDIAIIRTSFETTDLFPPDDPIIEEVFGMIAEARGNLVARLQSMLASPSGDPGEGFRMAVRWLLIQGFPRGALDSMMKQDVFCSVAPEEGLQDAADCHYFYEFIEEVDLLALLSQPAPEIYALFLADILESAETGSNYSSKYLFDRNVSQKYIAFLFATYAGADPMFYGGGGSSDFGNGSGVPRRPIVPSRSGGAAKPLPE